MSETIIVAIIGAVMAGLSGVVGAVWKQVQSQTEQIRVQQEKILNLTTENTALKAKFEDMQRDFSQLQAELASRDRTIQRLEDENRILRSFIRAHGLEAPEPSRRANDLPEKIIRGGGTD